MTEAQRVRFEKWVSTVSSYSLERQSEPDAGDYAELDTEALWKTWQAAYAAGAADENEACAKQLDKLRKNAPRSNDGGSWWDEPLYKAAKAIRARQGKEKP